MAVTPKPDYETLLDTMVEFWESVPDLRKRLESYDPLQAESDIIPDCNIQRDLFRKLLEDEAAGTIPEAHKAKFAQVKTLHRAHAGKLETTLNWWIRGDQ